MKDLRKIKMALVGVFFIATAMVLGSATILYADEPPWYTFSSGTTISSGQVNANFQALLTRIETLEAKLAPVSIVGTYDYVAVGAKMLIYSQGDSSHYSYELEQSGDRGTMVFTGNAASGTVTITPTSGGYDQLSINNEISSMLQSPSGSGARDKSLIGGTFSSGGTEVDSGTYTVSGSTVSMSGGPVATLSADGKILIFSSYDSTNRKTGLVIAIKR